ncbi:glycosyltransferase family 4 protein [Flexivirga sp. ID2601S]|uniref:Glycosyltransferase family 4 protein n=1 Tax=Flexivirga aerilata TaxID=1656889 RepID=A0A849ALL6_9MICO|nr:glycosyltransferase family 1 protein [Flexivirga aerilata]NNG39270.1 glycosyltransferase family 4 protein [Flexivirga aerilata]
MKVLFPERILKRHVGGNTTYTREIASRIEREGVEVSTIPSASHPVLTMARESTYGIRARADTIIHFSADTGALFPVRRSIATVHGVASRWIDVARTPRQEWIWRTRVQRNIRSTTALITVSESAADDVSSVFHVDRESIHVIPHGIDVRAFDGRHKLSTEVADKIPSEFVLYVGNIEPRKNLSPLIQAFSGSLLRSLGIPLVIAGKPAWNYDSTMRAITSSQDVIYLGFVSDEDRAALMQECTLFAFPSLYEGFGFPVLEAMAAGAPVATSRRGSLAEVAGPSWQLDELTAESLEMEIVSALNDRSWRSEAPNEGRAWASQFSWDRSVEAHMRVYRQVLRCE